TLVGCQIRAARIRAVGSADWYSGNPGDARIEGVVCRRAGLRGWLEPPAPRPTGAAPGLLELSACSGGRAAGAADHRRRDAHAARQPPRSRPPGRLLRA